jgi:hypothetical protein
VTMPASLDTLLYLLFNLISMIFLAFLLVSSIFLSALSSSSYSILILLCSFYTSVSASLLDFLTWFKVMAPGSSPPVGAGAKTLPPRWL